MNNIQTYKPKKCKNCLELFTPHRSLQIVCSVKCSFEYGSKLKEKKEQKDWKERKKVMKKDMLTKSDYIKILQQLVNRFVRQRDGNYCISCDAPINGKVDAGHLFSVGNYPSVRFDLRNINSQCIKCNQFNGGSILEYRENLIKKIGQKEFDELDKLAHQNRMFDIEEIKQMIQKFKELTK